jgi:hypothetical protein
MKDEEPIDFSLLDPSCDPAHWAKLVDSVATRAIGALRPWSVPLQLAAWSRPALALAAAAAAIVWGGAIFGSRRPTVYEEPAWAMARWAAEGELPPAWHVIGTLGEVDAAR